MTLPAPDPAVFGPFVTAVLIFAGTFASEDFTCITVGLYISEGRIHPALGILACFAGIYVSDLWLWWMGHLVGARILRIRRVAAWLPMQRIDALGEWLDRRGWAVIFAARFLPGSRFPLYVTAGVVGRNVWRFTVWTFLAAAIWTPAFVLLVAALGPTFVEPFKRYLGAGLAATAAAVLVLFVLVRLAMAVATADGRWRLRNSVERFRRYEFWPTWLFYLPLLPYGLWLSLRYRGATTPTAANPAIPHGGLVGESKHAILSLLPPDVVVPWLLMPPMDVEARLTRLADTMRDRGWTFPVILKPDAGQRGVGLKRIRSLEEARAYLAAQPAGVIAQPYHPGPLEAGVYYYRIPGEPTGHIFSITDKVFPEVVGDGRSTIEQLVRRHPRLRLQATLFFLRHRERLQDVPAAGEHVPMAVSGNHCQGTLFRDGSHLITPDLERAIDRIARHSEGLYVGRFDVRYGDVKAFRRGEEFAILEFNGITSESTNIYDPTWTLWRAYRTAMRQWKITFRIGYLNRKAGHRATSAWTGVREIVRYYRHREVEWLAD